MVFQKGHIPYNKIERVKINCSFCGKGLERTVSRFKYYKDHFCNKNCKGKWLKQYFSNPKNNPNYKHGLSIGSIFKCLFCGKEGHRDGYKQKYCSASCFLKHSWQTGIMDREKIAKGVSIRMNKLVKEGKHPFQRAETHIKSMRSSGKSSHGGSWIEKKTAWLLEDKGLPYITQFNIEKGKDKAGQMRYYFTDFYLPDFNLVIECDGEFWHKDVLKDRERDKNIRKQGYDILRLKGEDIRNNLRKCSVLIDGAILNKDKKIEVA